MSILDKAKCGQIIVFDTILLKNRKAFCIDCNINEQVMYKGLFGIKVVSKADFASFAKAKEIFNYIDHDLSMLEKDLLRVAYILKRKEKYSNVTDFVESLFRSAGIIRRNNDETKTSV